MAAATNTMTGEIVLALVLHFLHVTGPEGQSIDIAVDQIVSLRERHESTPVHEEVQCLIHTSDGKFVAVRETCKEVEALLDAIYKRRENE